MIDFALHRKSPRILMGTSRKKTCGPKRGTGKAELYPTPRDPFFLEDNDAIEGLGDPGSKRPSINTALRTTQALMDKYSVARNKYKPSKIGVLFIAESPPSSGGHFYVEETIGKYYLFRETMKALELWPSDRPMRKGCDKRSMLNEFRSLDFFLIDTCEFPVDKLRPKERRLSTIRGALTLPARVEALRPDRILIVKKTVFKPAIQALSGTRFASRILNVEPLPFPSHGNQKKYRTMLRRLLKKRLAGTS